MKRKNSKKGGIIAAVVGLSAVSLVSVGFASWIISAPDTATMNGAIQTEMAEDKNFTILNKSALQVAHNIVFGKPADTSGVSSPWLTNNGAVESLSYSEEVIVDNMDASTGYVGAKLVCSNDSTYSAAFTAGLVAAFPTVSVSARAQKSSGDYSGKYYVTVSFEFDWGEHFGGDNPFVYYNAHAADEIRTGTTTYAADARASLGTAANQGLYALNSLGYTLTIKTAASNTEAGYVWGAMSA